jgi:hypothetical protein
MLLRNAALKKAGRGRTSRITSVHNNDLMPINFSFLNRYIYTFLNLQKDTFVLRLEERVSDQWMDVK